MKLNSLLIVLLFSFTGLHSQDTIDNQEFKYNKLAVGISISSLLNSMEAAQVSVDVGLTNRVRLSSEIGYIFNSYFSNSTTGYRIKPSFEVLIYSGREIGFQIGAFALIRNLTVTFKEKVNHEEDYFEYIPVKKSKNLFGTGIAVALVAQITDRLMMEAGIGLGKGTLKVSLDKELDSTQTQWFIHSFDRVGEHDFPIVYFNYNFSYSIFK